MDAFTELDRSQPVVVALSGGVDSAVAAALLVEAGLSVIGTTMRLYDAKGSTASAGGRCCGPRDVEDARRVAAHLDIPFYVADYEADFNAAVVDDFLREYAAGRTPNPCVRCNQHIKFTPLLQRAKSLGAGTLVTGHYARLVGAPGARRLLRAVDSKKDQSYFLFNMPRRALDRVAFPLGGMTKDEVRVHAARLGLPNAEKAESQEICFVPDGNYAGFVASRMATGQGTIVDETGKTLGTHEGVHHFTVGQRRGIGVGSAEGPLYVLRLDAQRQEVTVGHTPPHAREIVVEELAEMAPLAEPVRASVQIRYRHAAQPAWLHPAGPDRVRVEFDVPERSPAPGQAAVFYRDDEVLGGGFIAGGASAA